MIERMAREATTPSKPGKYPWLRPPRALEAILAAPFLHTTLILLLIYVFGRLFRARGQ